MFYSLTEVVDGNFCLYLNFISLYIRKFNISSSIFNKTNINTTDPHKFLYTSSFSNRNKAKAKKFFHNVFFKTHNWSPVSALSEVSAKPLGVSGEKLSLVYLHHHWRSAEFEHQTWTLMPPPSKRGMIVDPPIKTATRFKVVAKSASLKPVSWLFTLAWIYVSFDDVLWCVKTLFLSMFATVVCFMFSETYFVLLVTSIDHIYTNIPYFIYIMLYMNICTFYMQKWMLFLTI